MTGFLEGAHRALFEVVLDCSEANWDGYGAGPVSSKAVGAMVRLIDVLPHDLPLPDFGADPDGDVSINWQADRREVISISVDSKGVLHWAMLDGDYSQSGSTQDLCEILPLIRRIACKMESNRA